jgi:hypothetical protein
MLLPLLLPLLSLLLSLLLFIGLRFHGLQDVFGYQEMFQVQAAACPPAIQVQTATHHQLCCTSIH